MLRFDNNTTIHSNINNATAKGKFHQQRRIGAVILMAHTPASSSISLASKEGE